MDPETSAIAAQADQFVHAQALPTLFEPIWALTFILLGVLAAWGLSRLEKLPGLRNVRRWLVLARVTLWTAILFSASFAVSWAVTEHWLVLGTLILAVVAIAGLDWLRNITAGLAVAFEGSFEVGDRVRYQDTEGKLVDFGARAVTLRASDGTQHQIPNEKFSRETVTNLEAAGEAACEIVISLPHGVSSERALRLARQAAFMTPLASPRHKPEAFLDVDRAGEASVELHIRGFAFDPAYREHFRSDVVGRIHDLLRTEKAVQRG